MRNCKKCVYPDTKPGLVLDSEGICQACRHAERKKKIDWTARWQELKKLCDKYRGTNGNYYDCLITGSGGKDSHFQTYIMKEKMKMNPLLINVANFSWTETGRRNFENWSEAFGCDILSLNLNRRLAKKLYRESFEKLGSPNWCWDLAIYTWPFQMGIKLGIPLLVYGENVSIEYGGPQKQETYSAREQIYNDVVKTGTDLSWVLGDGVTMKDLNPFVYPTEEEIEKAKLEPIYLSYFVPWSDYGNCQLAKKYGFRTLEKEWKREGWIEDFRQIDTIGYLVHIWLKYPKFGFQTVTDVCCYWIREGRITREEAKKLVEEHDHKLDPKGLKDFLEFTGYTEQEFWNIVEKFWNRDIFKKVNGKWQLQRNW